MKNVIALIAFIGGVYYFVSIDKGTESALKFEKDYEATLAAAEAADQPVLVYFSSTT